MKKQSVSNSEGLYDLALEAKIHEGCNALKEVAINTSKHFAIHNQPSPNGDSLIEYVGELKTGYEKLASDVLKHLQPSTLIPESKVEADSYREMDNQLEQKITDLQNKNHTASFELGKTSHHNMPLRIKVGLFLTGTIFIGEIAISSQALQVTGGSLFSSFIIAFSISTAVLLFSHAVGFLYKSTESKLKRKVILFGSIILVSGVFLALSMLRSLFLATHGITLNPIYFVVFNIFFYIVSFLISIFIFPSWEEIKLNSHKMKIQDEISKRNKEIEILRKEREALKQTVLENTKRRIKIMHYAKYAVENIKKKYYESVEIMKSTNMTYRTDRLVPDCFKNAPPELTIDDPSLTLISLNRK